MTDTRELKITRFIDAPPEKVWDVMVNRQEEWWCPRPWRVEIDRQERRAGGRAEMTMYGPDGEVMPQNGIYLAWDEGRRFVSTDAAVVDQDGQFQPTGPFLIGYWQVEPEGSGTRYTAGARHWTDEKLEEHKAMGFEAGWNACADQLQVLCEDATAEA